MKRFNLFLLLLFLLSVNFLLPQQKNVEGKHPHVNMLQDSTMVITFSKQQINAIQEYLELHPNLYLYTSDNIGPYVKIENYNYYKKGEMQFQYACWGDFNNDKYLDLTVVFKTKGNGGYPTFYIVVLQGEKDGTYDPLIIDTIKASYLDGVLYHKKENKVNYYISGVAGGSFQWKNGKLIVNKMMGD